MTSNRIEDELNKAGYRLGWIEKEVELLEKKIETLDDLSFKIKGWAITVWTGLITLSLTNDSWQLAALSVIVLFPFLLTDASYKRYQIRFAQRTREIMRFLNDRAFREEWAEAGFPIYDLLNIFTRDERQDPLDQGWIGLSKSLSKASVGLVYWSLMIFSILLASILRFS